MRGQLFLPEIPETKWGKDSFYNNCISKCKNKNIKINSERKLKRTSF